MISVCIATYNGEHYIEEQIASILPQLDDDDELIISDDGSKDGTVSMLSSFGDKRIKIYHNTGNHGVVPNFENALRHANGDVIFLADQDDVWKPCKVTQVMKAIDACDFIVHNAEMVDGNLKSQGIDFFTLRHTCYGYVSNLWKMRYLGCCMTFRKEALKYILPFPKGILWHDMWAAAILHLKFRGKLINEPLIMYRRHGDNASSSGEKSNWTWRFRFQYRWVIFYNSLLRVMKIK